MNTFRRRSAAAVLVSVSLLAAGCGGDSVRFLGEKVKDPGPFLGTIEQAWRSELTKGRVTVHKEARCYFSRGEESKEIDGLAFCGPARHYTETPVSEDGQEMTGTDAPGAVGGGYWDSYTFEGEPIEGGYQLADPKPETMGVTVPTGVVLFRLDGKTPPTDGDKLAPPPPPAAAPGFLATEREEPNITRPAEYPEAVVETPAYNYTVQAVGTMDTIRTEKGVRTPAPGEEFLVTEVAGTQGTWIDDYGYDSREFPEDEIVDVSPVYSITTPAGRKSLSILPPDSGGTSYVISSIPKDDKSTAITIGVAGRDQTVNLITGKVSDAVPPTAAVTVNQQYSTTAVSIPEKHGFTFEASHANTFTDAWLTPFHPQKGWAAKGKTWLILEAEDALFSWDGIDFGITPDFNASTIAQAKGVTYRNVVEARPSVSMEAGKTGWPVFEVDPSVRSFKITYQPIWRYEHRQDEWAISGTAKFKPMSFTVTFPK